MKLRLRRLLDTFVLSVLAISFVAALSAQAVREHRPSAPSSYVITNDPGGRIDQFIDKYTALRRSGAKVEIDGFCASACTLVTGMLPTDRVCVTPFAKLGFHSAFWINTQTGERGFSSEATRLLWHIYPENVRDLLRKRGWDGEGKTADHPNIIFVEGPELLAIYQPCKAS
jgi:hypothetical protein